MVTAKYMWHNGQRISMAFIFFGKRIYRSEVTEWSIYGLMALGYILLCVFVNWYIPLIAGMAFLLMMGWLNQCHLPEWVIKGIVIAFTFGPYIIAGIFIHPALILFAPLLLLAQFIYVSDRSKSHRREDPDKLRKFTGDVMARIFGEDELPKDYKYPTRMEEENCYPYKEYEQTDFHAGQSWGDVAGEILKWIKRGFKSSP